MPAKTIVVCAVALVPDVQATGGGISFWGDPVFSSNDLARWGVWDQQIDAATRAQLEAIEGVGLYPSLAAATTATGWID